MSVNESAASSPVPGKKRAGAKKMIGTFRFVDGGQYEGEFVVKADGSKIRQGNGSFTDTIESYQGEWENDAMHGRGVYKFATNAVYDGNFAKNLFDGNGTYRWPDGAVYTGGWRQNKMHGEGVYIDSQQVRWEGTFYNGKFKSHKSYVMVR
jgi:hypothetical protein